MGYPDSCHVGRLKFDSKQHVQKRFAHTAKHLHREAGASGFYFESWALAFKILATLALKAQKLKPPVKQKPTHSWPPKHYILETTASPSGGRWRLSSRSKSSRCSASRAVELVDCGGPQPPPHSSGGSFEVAL